MRRTNRESYVFDVSSSVNFVDLFFLIVEAVNLRFRNVDGAVWDSAKTNVYKFCRYAFRTESTILLSLSISAVDACKKEGFTPNIKFASSLSEEMLWVEAGVGVCILDSRNLLYSNSAVKFLDVEQLSDPSMTMAWHEAHYNPMKKIFIENFLK